MDLHHHGIMLIVFIFLLQHTVYCQEKLKGPPQITGSYLAYGEVAEALEDTSGILPQVAFEESYNSATKNAAFTVWSMGINVTFVENFNTNQTFRYINNTVCDFIPVSDWVTTDSSPSLLHYESTNGTVRFSLKQLFSLSDQYLVKSNVSDSVRGIPARKWEYEIKENTGTAMKRKVTVEAYWSDGTWDTSAVTRIVPLSYVVTRLNYTVGQKEVKIHQQYISVFGFAVDTYNHKLFKPFPGVYCENRVSTLKFPDVDQWPAMTIHSEFILPDYREIRYVDHWFDSKNKLLRMDSESIREENPRFEFKDRKYQSEITLGKLGVVYKLKYYKGLIKCELVNIEDYEFDIQTLFNIKMDTSLWSLGNMMGVNESSYVYTGQTVKRNIPCHLYQGIRKDWPEPNANVTSMWEWCFNVNMTANDNVVFANGEFGLIDVQIKILESTYPYFSEGFRLIHHFYHTNYKKDPDIMDSTDFDISRCYGEETKLALQFESIYEITKDNLRLVENATSDRTFLQKWKSIIYLNAGLDQMSLRISNVETTVINNKLFVKFHILDVYYDLPENTKAGQTSAAEAEKNLRKNIDAKAVFIFHSFKTDGKLERVTVKVGSLQYQLNKTFQAHTLPPPPPKPSTTSMKPFTLRTPPPHHTDKTDSTKSTDSEIKIKTTPDGWTGTDDGDQDVTTKDPRETKKTIFKYVGNQKGTVAGVSIAMLLVGITLGSFGTFYKYNGLPSCLQRG